MRRYLVVANQTLGGRELREEIRKRVAAGDSSFYVLVPNTRAANYHVVPAAGGLVPMPGLATGYGGPPTEEEGIEEGKDRPAPGVGRVCLMGGLAVWRLGRGNPGERGVDTRTEGQLGQGVWAGPPQ